MSASKRIVVITGANGNNGQEVAKALQQYPDVAVRLLVRDPAKATELKKYGELVKGDLADVASLEIAFKDASALFLLCPFVPNANELGKNAIAAAKKVGVKFILNFSAVGSSADAPLWVQRDHAERETLVRESGIEYAILQPTFFMSNLPLFNKQTLEKDGKWYGSAGDGKSSSIAPSDIAEIAAKILVHPAGHNGQSYVLTGLEVLNNHEISALASKVWGKQITYVDVEPDAYLKQLQSYGMPDVISSSLHGLQQAQRAGHTSATSSDAEKLLGRKPTTWEEYLKENRI